MFILMIIGFFTSRLLLEALGIEDLGVYNVVGSIIIMFDFVSSSLTNSTQRYLNLGLGKNNIKLTQRYFSQSLSVHIVLSLFVLLILETLGLWIICNKLVIPVDRYSAAIYTYQLSVCALLLRIVCICYESNIIAREKMSIFAYFSIFEGGAKLLICFLVINNHSFDRLVYYSFLLLIVNMLLLLFNMMFCRSNYPESRYSIFWDKVLFREMFSFVGINSFGVISWALGKQGINIVLNLFFGPAVNGAKGLATTIERVVTQFQTNINLAVRPQITKNYAQGNMAGMVKLAEKSTRYCYYLILFLTIPFFFKTDLLLTLWLGNVPPYTSGFVVLLMCEALVNVLTNCYIQISNTIGKIRNIQIYGRIFTLSGLPISYFALEYFPNPYLPVVIMVTLSIFYLLFVLYDVNRNIHFGFRSYCKYVALPIGIVTGVSLTLGAFIYNINLTENLLGNFFIESALLYMLLIVVIYYWGVERSDRTILLLYIKKHCK